MPSILLIEDDDLLRKTLATALVESGYTVKQAADGAQGVKLFLSEPTELVITDIVMPNQEGTATVAALRREFPDLAIIAMSGGAAKPPVLYLKIARALGANRTLEKPFDLPTLLTAIEVVLAERSKN